MDLLDLGAALEPHSPAASGAAARAWHQPMSPAPDTVEARLARLESALQEAVYREEFLMRLIANPDFLSGGVVGLARLRNLPAEEYRILFAFLRHQRRWTTLDASYCTLTHGDVAVLAKSLREHTALQHLDLSGADLGPDEARVLGEALGHNKSIVSLNLHSNNLGDEGVRLLLDGLRDNKALTTLLLSKNAITAVGCAHIAEFLTRPNAIQALNLKSNHFGNDGVVALLPVIRRAGKLHKLSLRDTAITQEGLRELSKAMPSSGLHELHISNNPVDGLSVKDLCKGLETNKSLTSLIMFGTNACDVGAEAVARLLLTNSTIHELDVRHNHITDVGGQAIVTSLADNRSLTAIHHFGNDFSAAFAATLSTTLKARKISTASTDDADEETVSPVKEKLDRKPSFYRRLSQRDPPSK